MKRKNDKGQFIHGASHLILVMLLLYPLLFSFSHSLSHHRSAHHHHHCEHSCSTNINESALDLSASVISLPTKTCPICDYEFAPLLEPEKFSEQGEIIFHITTIPQIKIHLYGESLICQFPARAPPLPTDSHPMG